MSKIYFLDGLGSNRYYAADLAEELAKLGLLLDYLPLPGHPEHMMPERVMSETILSWLDEVLPPDPVLLLGYSLGADIAAAYAAERPQRVRALLLLDGACHDMAAMPLEEELAGAQAYLDNQVFKDMAEHVSQTRQLSQRWSMNLERAEMENYVYDEHRQVYRLNLNITAVCDLLRARRAFGATLQSESFVTPTRVIISDQPKEALAQKMAFLSQCSPSVTTQVFPNSQHDFYMVYPRETAAIIASAMAELTASA